MNTHWYTHVYSSVRACGGTVTRTWLHRQVHKVAPTRGCTGSRMRLHRHSNVIAPAPGPRHRQVMTSDGTTEHGGTRRNKAEYGDFFSKLERKSIKRTLFRRFQIKHNPPCTATTRSPVRRRRAPCAPPCTAAMRLPARCRRAPLPCVAAMRRPVRRRRNSVEIIDFR